MNRTVSFLFLLSLMLGACASPATPAPYSPDTPPPPQINAPLVETPSLISVRFLNSLDGWGVTETQIVRTNDGGVTWYNVTPPDVTETGYLVEMFVLDARRAWLQKPDYENYPNSGSLFRTLDGGLTWTKFPTPFSGGDFTFLDAEDGWMMAVLGVATGRMGVSIFQTSDGGATWTQKFTNDPNLSNAGDSLPLGGLKSGIAPLNMQTAWVYGVTYSSGAPYIYRTDDGGVNWREVDLPLPPDAEDSELGIEQGQMRFVTPDDGFIAMRVTRDIYRMAIYVTHDAGDTWTLTPMIVPDGGSADFLSAEEAVIYNGQQFHVTRDSARTWSVIPPDVKFGETFAQMDFINALSGWVITMDPSTNSRSLYRTHDGGATWLPVIP